MTDRDRHYNVLFLDTGNATRSIMAELVLNRAGMGRFKAYSAGAAPRDAVHPYAIDLLKKENYPVDGLVPKSWDAFATDDAPHMDFIFTLSNESVAYEQPAFPGDPMIANWQIDDPAAVEGTESEKRFAFADALRMITNRVQIMVNLPMRSLDKLARQKLLDAIGDN